MSEDLEEMTTFLTRLNNFKYLIKLFAFAIGQFASIDEKPPNLLKD